MLEAVGGGSGAPHERGMGGGTRAGMTPAFDTPTERPEKKLTELEGERNKPVTNLVSVLLTCNKLSITFRIFLTLYFQHDWNVSFTVKKSKV